MSDMGEDDSLGKFLEQDSGDEIKPIETEGGGTPVQHPPDPADVTAPGNKEDTAQDTQGPDVEEFLKDALPESEPLPTLEELEDRNYVNKGDFVNLTEKKPTLKQLRIGCGWDLRNYEGVPPDLDVSLFLLDQNEKTREDDDFVFYNNPTTLDGAVRHVFDSRTGAGVGDDEIISVDLNGIPFDITKIMIVLSVYDEGGLKDDHFGMVKNVSIGIVDEEDTQELLRYEISEDDLGQTKAMKVAALVREGPVWFFDTLGESVKGGLAKVAMEYGIIIQELTSSEE